MRVTNSFSSLGDMKQLSTVNEVIEALGGEQPAGALVGVGIKAVQQWKWQKQFPAKTYLAIISELGKSGLDADASLWSFVNSNEPLEAQE